jgi:outer membrane lipoprotein-sorting protein
MGVRVRSMNVPCLHSFNSCVFLHKGERSELVRMHADCTQELVNQLKHLAENTRPCWKMARLAWICIGIVALMMPVSGYGDAPGMTTSSEWFDAISECYGRHAGIQGAFTHEFLSVHGKSGAPMTGTIQIARTGRFRMAYVAPEQREIVYDGRKVRASGPSLSGVYEYANGEDELFRFLLDLYGKSYETIETQFEIRILRSPSRDKRWVIELKPRKPDPFTSKIIVTTGHCPTAITRIIVVDRAGNLVRLTFRDITPVNRFPKGLFRLKSSANVPVVRP